MPLPTPPHDQTETIADFLADREGLDGAARGVFLRLLREGFGFGRASPRRIVPVLPLLTLLLAGLGLAFEGRTGLRAAAALPWLGIAAVGLALALAAACSGTRMTPINRELEWRAYCFLIRPLILRRHPGLLDCNLGSASGIPEAIIPGQGRALWAVFFKRDVDFWLTAGVGWTLGMLAAVAWPRSFVLSP
jgi:hypothetical protein